MNKQEKKPVGKISWSELISTDFETSCTFYQELFGWKATVVPGRGDAQYALLTTTDDREPFAGILEMPEHPKLNGMPSCWQTYVTVSDLDFSVTKATAIGAQVVVPVMDIPNIGKIAAVKSPEGAVISMIQYT